MTAMIFRNRKYLLASICLGFLFTASSLFAQVPAFPGAEGFGALATGGRGGRVIIVNNLNDSGTGSLRAAIGASGTRTVVFTVSGTISLRSSLSIQNGNITIAGQTAPGGGITIRNYALKVAADNVIIRFIRSRHGDTSDSQDDAMNGRYFDRIILDHCSMSWSVDECASFYDNTNFTMQYCILSESLYKSNHDKGNHGYGGIWGGQGASFHHNLLAHHTSRNPRFCGSRYTNEPAKEKVDHRNNVIYNWGGNSAYGGEAGNHNMVANYYKPGPATSNSVRDRIIDPDQNDNGYGFYYVAENVTQGTPATTSDNSRGVDGLTSAQKEQVLLDTPIDAPALTPHTAYEAFEYVLAHAGAVLPQRDIIDTRVIHETVTGTAQYGGSYGIAKGIIDSQNTVGGWPTLESTEAPADTDMDGMPDEWEDARGLDKNDPADRNGDLNGNGYTNLEDYLNGLVEAFEYLLRPVELHVDTIIEYTVSLAWKDISENESGFVLERNDGLGWNELASLPAGTQTYTDESISINGLYHYRMKAINGSMESFYTDSINADLQHVGIYETDNILKGLHVYPNPSHGIIYLKYALESDANIEISLFDITGRQVFRMEASKRDAGSGEMSLDTSFISGGLYLLNISAGGQSYNKKILIEE